MSTVARVFRRRGRLVGAAVAATVSLALTEPSAAWAEPGVPDPPNQLITDTGKGKLAEADRDFAIKVRLAGLWEIPAGEMAQEKSNNPRIKKIGQDIAAQHVVLDEMVRGAAAKLKIDLPDEPNEDQQGWLDEMRDAEGEEFDQIYIDRLRSAHGKIFPAIATIRTSTRNDTIRKLAQRANQFVMTHLTLLESSNLVDFAALPTAPAPNAAPPASGTAGGGGTVLSSADQNEPSTSLSLPVLGLIVVVVAGIVLFLSRNLWADPRRRRRRRYRSYY
ncbi:DUF4142 domain-containing protein [Paractinoplanes brasiliensis]|uniref:Putative outer membrane protein n=1 Tax=Paractinoplanes brasiliensis TaxID=52695 RepID=A0A4R6JME8_9ACTN|nr:DUF4142 domain-containing protein [Actinoplanes brasiliensis]TDO37490.1 putative outer membrane protein [Actinoplanes brasiliensis]GID29190.1 hypothetical protein Abr02nite_41730 [Actinoplanes brasiliensis]